MLLQFVCLLFLSRYAAISISENEDGKRGFDNEILRTCWMFNVLTFSKTILLSGTLNEVKEMKGLDIVRRDWCDLAKDAGKYVLYQLLCKLKNVFIERTNEELTNDLSNQWPN